MAKKLYVGNISFQTTSEELVQVFSQYGTVLGAQAFRTAKPAAAAASRSSKCTTAANEAIAALHGSQLGGRTLTVNEAKPREERPRLRWRRVATAAGGGGGYGGGGGGRGGYGGGGGGRGGSRGGPAAAATGTNP